jgi:hypothetical protein
VTTLYVRSVNARGSSWFRGAQTRHEARINADGVEKDVNLIETDDMNDEIDGAYHTKYGRSYPTIVPSIVEPQAPLDGGARSNPVRNGSA